jgi:hypothetical protein
MANPFGIPQLSPEDMAAQQRYSNWLTSVNAGWHYAEKMNCRDAEKYPSIAKTLAEEYYKHLQEGEKLLEVATKA